VIYLFRRKPNAAGAKNNRLQAGRPFFDVFLLSRERPQTMSLTIPPSFDQLETFANQNPQRDYTVEIVCPEFTSLCPKTGQPDFGTITYTYVPDELCVELKSLKLYLQRFRQEGIFYETVVNRLLDDFVKACKPRRCMVVGAFTPRGGITTTVTCAYEASLPTG
jgi:7-cyano-7-deazaguanine reductase